MRIYIVLLAIICCISGNEIFAQMPLSTMMSLEGYVNKSGKYLMQVGDDTELIGSPYLEDSFKTGDLRIDGEWYRGNDLRYDSYGGVFEVVLEEGIFVIDPAIDAADSIIYNKETFVRRDMHPGEPQRMQYLVALYQGDDYSLYKKYSSRLNNAVKTDGYSEAKPAEFKPNPPEYFIFRKQIPEEVKGTGSIADIFGVDRKTVRRYVRQNKFKIKKDEDMIEIVKHFSSNPNQ